MAQTLEELIIELKADVGGIRDGLNKSKKAVKEHGDFFSKVFKNMELEAKKVGGAIAGYFTVQAVLGFSRSVLDAGMQVQGLNNKMLAATGSLRSQQMALKFVREESDRLGLVFQSTADQYAGFVASATRSGLTLRESEDIFRGVSEAVTAMQLSGEKSSLVFYALTQMASKGKVSMEELRQQLGESLPGALQVFAAAMGVSNQKFEKMVENGEVLTEDLKKLGEGLSREFGDIAVKASNSAQAALNRFQNTLMDLKTSVADGGALQNYASTMNVLSTTLKDPAVVAGISNIANGFGFLAASAVAGTAAISEWIVKGTSLFMNLDGIRKNLDFLRGDTEKYTVAAREAAEAQNLLNIAMKDAVSYNGKTDSFGITSPDRAKTNKELFGKKKPVGDSKDSLRAQIESMKFGLGTETEQIAMEYEKRNELLKQALAKQAITRQDYNELMAQSELEYKQRFGEIWAQGTAERLKAEEDATSKIQGIRGALMTNSIGMLQVFGQKNKAFALAALALEKGVAIARAVMETNVGAAAALKYDPTGALSANVMRMGYANVAVIAATGLAQAAMMGGGGNGGGGGGVSSGGSVSSSGGDVATTGGTVTKQVNINLQGRSFFNANDMRELVRNLNDYIGDGTVKLNLTGAA